MVTKVVAAILCRSICFNINPVAIEVGLSNSSTGRNSGAMRTSLVINTPLDNSTDGSGRVDLPKFLIGSFCRLFSGLGIASRLDVVGASAENPKWYLPVKNARKSHFCGVLRTQPFFGVVSYPKLRNNSVCSGSTALGESSPFVAHPTSSSKVLACLSFP